MMKLTTAQYLVKCAIQVNEEILTISDCGDYICIITPLALYKVDINGKVEREKL